MPDAVRRPPPPRARGGQALKRPRLLVVGGGFAGLWATRELARDAIDITLIDRSNHHLFQPLLYQVATAALSPADIASPLRHMLRDQRNVEVVLGEVTALNPAARSLRLADGRTLQGDALLLATGAGHAYFGHDDWAAHALGLKTLQDALGIRARVLAAFERAESAATEAEREAWLHFAVVGGGPTGVELAGALAELARQTLRDEFRRTDPARATVRLIEAGPQVLPSFPAGLQARARAQLERLGVQVLTGARVTGVDAQGYRLGGQAVACRTVLWAAGVAASPLGRMLGAPLDGAGRVRVAPDLSVPGHPRVFVAGDLASVVRSDGRPVPGVSPAAKQMGTHVARSLRRRLAGRPTTPFVYRDPGQLATIGRMAAVVDLRGLRFWGPAAWWFWLAAHVYFLIGFRNRLAVLLNWASAYWTFARHARLLFADPPATAPDAPAAGPARVP